MARWFSKEPQARGACPNHERSAAVGRSGRRVTGLPKPSGATTFESPDLARLAPSLKKGHVGRKLRGGRQQKAETGAPRLPRSTQGRPALPQTHESSSPGRGSRAGRRGASGPAGQLASLPFLVCLSNLIPARLPLKFAVGRKAAREGAGGLACLSHSKSLTGTLLHGRCTPANCTGPGRGLCSPGVTGCLLSLGPTGPPAEGCLTGCRLGAGCPAATPLGFASSRLQFVSRDAMALSSTPPSADGTERITSHQDGRPGEKPDSAH